MSRASCRSRVAGWWLRAKVDNENFHDGRMMRAHGTGVIELWAGLRAKSAPGQKARVRRVTGDVCFTPNARREMFRNVCFCLATRSEIRLSEIYCKVHFCGHANH
jgi:hypothetical protein